MDGVVRRAVKRCSRTPWEVAGAPAALAELTEAIKLFDLAKRAYSDLGQRRPAKWKHLRSIKVAREIVDIEHISWSIYSLSESVKGSHEGPAGVSRVAIAAAQVEGGANGL